MRLLGGIECHQCARSTAVADYHRPSITLPRVDRWWPLRVVPVSLFLGWISLAAKTIRKFENRIVHSHAWILWPHRANAGSQRRDEGPAVRHRHGQPSSWLYITCTLESGTFNSSIAYRPTPAVRCRRLRYTTGRA